MASDTKPYMNIDLKGPDGNIFAVLGLASRHLSERDSKEMRSRIMNTDNYEDALSVIREYVDF